MLARSDHEKIELLSRVDNLSASILDFLVAIGHGEVEWRVCIERQLWQIVSGEVVVNHFHVFGYDVGQLGKPAAMASVYSHGYDWVSRMLRWGSVR